MTANERRVVVWLVAPFFVLPLLARLAVGPIGDALAAAVGHVAPTPVVAAAESDEEDDAPRPTERRASSEIGPRRVARWVPPVSSARLDGGALPKGGTIVVPASLIEKAMQDKRAGARDVVDADGKPFGAKLHGVGKYRSGLQDGDIVIEVGGVRVRSTNEMTQEGLKQAAGGATKLTGKIIRGETTFDVVLELPARP